MTTFRIEVFNKDKISNPKLVAVAHQLGIDALAGCLMARVFFLKGDLSREDIERLGTELLADPVTETFQVVNGETVSADHCIDVTLLAGVTDAEAEHLLYAGRVMGIAGLHEAATGQLYMLAGNLNKQELETLARKAYSNEVIQKYAIDERVAPPFIDYPKANPTVETILLREADDTRLVAISEERRLALNLEEMQAIRAYYQSEGCDPTDVELEMLAQTWSEHCVHKTFKAQITYNGPLPGAKEGIHEQKIAGLIDDYLKRVTDELDKDWVLSAFVDNAGIIRFDDNFDLAFKVETHNHPSAIEPFGGANTGVGGVIRDVIGVSARPIANTDVLCFGPQEMLNKDVPEGVLHPRRVKEGVVHGIEDYGNKMGIPTVNGAILYHPGYTSNPLVFCGSLGILPHGSHRTTPQPNDLIVLIGGRTGRDGLRGATFSSMEMDGTTGDIAGSSVQIGHPINEKQVLEVVMQARGEGLYNAITDCGAGGLSSAVGEMGETIGADVQLADVPLKYSGLRPWEIWLSEAQERMVLAVSPDKWERLQEVARAQDVEAVAIGSFTPTGRLTLRYENEVVGDIDMAFLHDGLPPRHMKAEWSYPRLPQEDVGTTKDQGFFENTLISLLAHPNIRCREDTVRRFDHEVQGTTAVKPLVGEGNKGPGDAAVLVPLDTVLDNPAVTRAVALSNGICPQFGDIDPYAMAWAAVDEAMRNIVAVGADPEQVALLDNFSWGNPNLKDRLGALVRCVQGCYDAAKAFGTPFISGKDSLNNEYLDSSGKRHAIPGTLLISAVGIVPDVNETVTSDFKLPGNTIYLVGETRDELGGSHYYKVNNLKGGQVPQPVPQAPGMMKLLHNLIREGLVQACHDCSEGGVAVALAEMCIGGNLGAVCELDEPRIPVESMLFAESLSRFIVEVREEDREAFESLMLDTPLKHLGIVTDNPRLVINGKLGTTLCDMTVKTLELSFRGPSPDVEVGAPPPIEVERIALDRMVNVHTSPPKVLILHANGTNRDREAELACRLAGGDPEIVHINQLIHHERHLMDYAMLVIPGGFSYGDDLGAGMLLAKDIRYRLPEDIEDFIADGRPVLGICNGFQVLVKAGLLPGSRFMVQQRPAVTLSRNTSDQFECRWVYLKPNLKSANLFTDGLDDLMYCPVAHGEGRVMVKDPDMLKNVWQNGLATLIYSDENGQVVPYPGNPNGSVYGIAALGNPLGNVMGLMPHPEDHIFPWQHPRWQRGERGMLGLRLFENGIKFS
ncbi:MAG: phosphoribosylformylglycinamidine synthase subunit PurL [Chloroflexi bacterium]|nr:phosphoribosylformylglycinamidine synthase subunit PurL [Chloroflexota bacterium]